MKQTLQPSRSSKFASTKSLRRGAAKIVFGFTIGLSAISSYAVTIDQVVADMSSPSEALVIDPRFSWQYNPAVTMYAPRGDAIPSWWTGNRPEWCYSVLTWFTALEAQGNGATNTRVQVKDLRFYVLSQSTRTWKQLDTKANPYTELWKYPFAYAGDNSAAGMRNESTGGVSMKPKYPNFHHGYGNPISITPQDVRAVYVAMDFRLVVDDPNKPDDRASAKYVVDSGGDYWPGNGQGDWSLGYAPGMGNGRMLLATSNWRTATMIVPNPNYGATMQEMKTNPPPGLEGSGTATTTTTAAATTTTTRASTTTTAAPTTTTAAATTTTTRAATTTTAAATTTTTKAATTTTTVGSVTTTTAPATTPTPVSTSAATAITAKHSGKCIDLSGWSTTDGAKIAQWSCHGGGNQKWALRDIGGAQYQVVSGYSGKCIGVAGDTSLNGAALQQTTCGTAASQLWTRRTTASGHSQLVSQASGKCMNVRGYSAADGAILEQNACTNSDSQLFALPVATPQSLTAKHSGKCLDLSGWSTANGTIMQQWACNGGTNQQWLFRDMGNARYAVISRASGKCLDIKDGSTADGASIQQSDCNGTTRQLWTFQREAGGYNKLKSAHSGKCLDVVAVSTADGAKLHQWNCGITGGDNQRWMIK